MKTKIIYLLLICFSFAKGQDRFDILDEKLNQLSKNYPGLNEKVELSVNSVSIQEFVRAIGTNNNLNVNVEPTLDIKITNNFKNVTAKEVFIFLCKRFDLEIVFTGPIMSFLKYTPPPPPIQVKLPAKKNVNIKYEPTTDILSYDLNNDTLSQVTKEITRQSGKNIIYSPEFSGKVVSGFIQSAPFNSALEKLAFSNDFKISLSPDDFYIIEKKIPIQDPKSGNVNNTTTFGTLGQNNSVPKTTNTLVTIVDGLITVNAQNIPINELVNSVSKELDKNYFLFSDLKGNATAKINDASYDEFLKLLFNGTDYTFKKEGEIYLFGDRNLEGLRQSKLITLKNRTVEKVLELIPSELKKGIDLKIFEDLNGLIVSGSQPRITELESFLRQIDLVVPLVHIEVIIADIRKSNTLSAGISAGLGSKPASATNGAVLPNVDLSLNSSTINNLISGINGLGIINLGSVTPNFYITIKALEEQGVLKVRSTPQIATLNGHEAKLSIGNTAYYLEVQNQLVNNTNVNQNLLQSQQYKAVNADLSISIDPQISGDEQITMTINVKQSSFTERISNTAPPGTINRNFESLVRVKNGEMIMLGGLEENTTNHSGKGLPGISRIPVLRWLLGNRTKTKSENKLTIFIKPTIIYS
jgi:type IV pilus assembly protein PilQ